MKKHFLLLAFILGACLIAQEKTHTVEAKETLYGLSKKYNTNIEDLKEANPQLLERTPQIGETIIIPPKNRKKNNKVAEAVTNEKNIISIAVQPKETLYGLSKKYNTTVEGIKKLNPSMNENGPKIGEVIKILNNTGKKPEEINPPSTVIKNSTTIENSKLDFDGNLSKTTTEKVSDPLDNRELEGINVLFILPFNTKGAKSSIEQDIAVHFYSGAQIALDSLYRQGKKINVQLIDSKDSLESTINTYNFSQPNVIIGPLFKSEIIALANKETNTYIVSPFSSNDDLDSYNNVILYETKEQILSNKLIDELNKSYKNEKIFITYSDNMEKTAEHFKTVLLDKYEDAEVVISKSPQDIVNTDPTKKIYSILVSNNDTFVAKYLDVITTMNSDKIQPISLFYSSLFDNNKYETKLTELELIYSDNKYVNGEGFNELKTINAYKNKFCTYPGKYAIIGFDITYDILNRINKKGKLSDANLKEEQKQLSNKYYFRRVNNKSGAWANQGTRIIQLYK